MEFLIVGLSRSIKTMPVASWAIRLYQGGTSYSHIYLRQRESWMPSDLIIHASEGKVQMMSDPQFNKRHKKVLEFKIPIPDKIVFNKYRQTDTSLIQYVKDEMHEISGDDYGFMQNLGIVLVDIVKLIGYDIKNPFQKGWNCSEFVSIILRHVFPKAFLEVDPQTVTPKKVKKILDKLALSGDISLL